MGAAEALPPHTPRLPLAWREELLGTGATLREAPLATLRRGADRQTRIGVAMIRPPGEAQFRMPALRFRAFFRAEDGGWRPAENSGFSVYLDELPTLAALIPEAAQLIRRMATLRRL